MVVMSLALNGSASMSNAIASMLQDAPHLPTGDIPPIYGRHAQKLRGIRSPGWVLSGDQLLDLAVEVLSFDRIAAAAWIARASEILLPERRPNVTERSSGGLAPWQVNKVIAYVDDKLGSRIRTSECAQVVRLSTSHFSRVFKISFNQTFVSYVIQRRIERAQERMMLTDVPLSQIALDCGFADQSHLSGLFRRVVGVSPGMWRRRHQPRLATSYGFDATNSGYPRQAA